MVAWWPVSSMVSPSQLCSTPATIPGYIITLRVRHCHSLPTTAAAHFGQSSLLMLLIKQEFYPEAWSFGWWIGLRNLRWLCCLVPCRVAESCNTEAGWLDWILSSSSPRAESAESGEVSNLVQNYYRSSWPSQLSLGLSLSTQNSTELLLAILWWQELFIEANQSLPLGHYLTETSEVKRFCLLM